jgi:hypothetical protein
MTTADAIRSESAPLGLLSRLIGVLTSPGETFRNLAQHPRWLDMLLLITLVVSALQFWFLSTEAGQHALLDQQVRQLESFGMTVGDEQYAQMQQGIPMARYFATGAVLVFSPLMTLIIAGVLFAVFNAGLGGNAHFRQVLSVVTHAGVVTLLQHLFLAPLNYARESMSSATNLAVFLPMLDEGSLAARFLGIIDLFIIWWLVVLAIGLGVLYKRRTQPIAAGLLVVYVLIAAIVALVMRAFTGGN